MLPNGLGAQLRTTAPPRIAEPPKVNARRLPNLDWNALLAASCSALLGSAHVLKETPSDLASLTDQFNRVVRVLVYAPVLDLVTAESPIGTTSLDYDVELLGVESANSFARSKRAASNSGSVAPGSRSGSTMMCSSGSARRFIEPVAAATRR